MINEKRPFQKNLSSIPKEEAHGGSGARQVIFSSLHDNITKNVDAWTKGFLPSGAFYDWHKHEEFDEFFIVVKDSGSISYEDGIVFNYKEDDVIFNPANLPHKIENTGNDESIFFFIRVKA
jgi:mannose-6-phosphate isomerase-like protein (cupin superfamily)